MEFDLLIKNGTIVDGTGSPSTQGDVAVKGGVISEIGRRIDRPARRIINAEGLVVAPGFIDIHSHSEFVLLDENHIDILAPFLRQGITTIVVGNCGSSMAPINRSFLVSVKQYNGPLQAGELEYDWKTMGEALERLETQGVALNVVPLVGHGTIRVATRGFDSHPPSRGEMSQMKLLLRQALEEGVHGMSAGLGYAPGFYASTEELVELAKIVSEFDCTFSCHSRGLTETLVEAVEEVINIGRKADVRVQLSHLCAMGRSNWPLIDEALVRLEAARERDGIDIATDAQSYTAGSTTFTAIFPAWAREGGPEKLLRRLEDPGKRQQIRQDIENYVPTPASFGPSGWPDNLVRSVGWENIWITCVASDQNKSLEGKSMADIAAIRGEDPFEVAANLTLEERGQIRMLVVGAAGDLDNDEYLQKIIAYPYTSMGTDAILTGRGKPNRGAYGAFPRVLGHFVREVGLLGLEEAIRKMTFLSAQRYDLRNRGVLKRGASADVTIFNPVTVSDTTTYFDTTRDPIGIEYVIINGHVAVEKGELRRGRLAGMVIRRDSG